MEKIRVMVSVKQLGLGWARKRMKKLGLGWAGKHMKKLGLGWARNIRVSMKKLGLSLKKLGLAWKKLGLGLASLAAPAPNFTQSLSWPPSITTKSVGTHPETNHFQ